jgi:GNAT superfamily N-acetyltransferase
MNNPQSFTVDDLVIKPLIPDLWSDFEQLFGSRGAYGGCWCMWWRISRSKFEKGQYAGNREAMKTLVESGTIPGLIVYQSDVPCGWCSVAPREHYRSLERSRVLKRIDNEEVWSVVCFFIDKKFRGAGLGEKLIYGAIEFVKANGGKIIEAYPTASREKELPPVSSFMGIPKIFKQVGFREVHRPSASKVIMRYYIEKPV